MAPRACILNANGLSPTAIPSTVAATMVYAGPAVGYLWFGEDRAVRALEWIGKDCAARTTAVLATADSHCRPPKAVLDQRLRVP